MRSSLLFPSQTVMIFLSAGQIHKAQPCSIWELLGPFQLPCPCTTCNVMLAVMLWIKHAHLLQIAGKRWRLDIGARQEVALQLSSVDLPGGAQVKNFRLSD